MRVHSGGQLASIAALGSWFVPAVRATEIHVPTTFSTIQAAIDAAQPGDEIIVAAGVWTGAGNKNLDPLGKAITIRSADGPESCIIDCEGDGRGFFVHSLERLSTIIQGFTIRNGFAIQGGAIATNSTSPTIRNMILSANVTAGGAGLPGEQVGGGAIHSYSQPGPSVVDCLIEGNTAQYSGGGIHCAGSNVVIQRCTIRNNTGQDGGGVKSSNGSGPTIDACLIVGNQAYLGGGFANSGGGEGTIRNTVIAGNWSATLGGGILGSEWGGNRGDVTNCTIVGNSAAIEGGGIHLLCNSRLPRVWNSVLWGNSAPSSAQLFACADVTVAYCNIQGGPGGVGGGPTWLSGNLDADPLLADQIGGDFRLQACSPSVNAGDPGFVAAPEEFDADGAQRVYGQRVDMGAYELAFVDSNDNGVPDACECFSWTHRASNGPAGRYRHGMVYDTARGVTLLFGGADNSLADSWQWDGNAWFELCNPCGPAGRVNSPLAYDGNRERVVMFGGHGVGFLNDTWEWDASAWLLMASGGPSPREGHILVHDTLRTETVLFGGGQGFSGYQGDTWTWNGAAWNQVSISGPAARQEAAAAFDEARGVVVLFGGRADNSYFGDTWTWNGAVWTQVSSTGPAPRAVHSMTYDSQNERVILFGGGNGLVPFGDTWLWDGVQWTQNSAPGPQPGVGYGLAYDRARQRGVLFGGATTGAPFDETWELDFGGPEITQQPMGETAIVGGLASFTVTATDSVAYQWRRSGANLTDNGRIAGATTANLTITGVQATDAGAYDVVISSSCGSMTSTLAFLTVHPDCGSDALLPLLLVSSKETDSVVAYHGLSGQHARTFNLAAAGVDYPNGLISDANGNFYVASVGTDRVLKFNGRTGQLLRQYTDGGLNNPDGILIHESTPGVPTLLVSSFSTNSIEQYDLDSGAFMADFVVSDAGIPGATLAGPAGLAHAANGNLLVASQIGHQVLEFDAATGVFVRVVAQGCGLNGPEGLLILPNGDLLVASFLGGDVLRFSPDGSCGPFISAGDGGLAGPSTFAWAPNGNILVASRHTNNVLEFDAETGAPVGVFAAGGGLIEPTHIAVAYWCDGDCNEDGMPDRWDVDSGRLPDVNYNHRPDDCEGCIGDINGSGDDRVALDDLTLLLSNYGCSTPPCPGDLDEDGDVDLTDLTIMLSLFGTTCP